MTRACAWCGHELAGGTADVSHGMCRRCERRMDRELAVERFRDALRDFRDAVVEASRAEKVLDWMTRGLEKLQLRRWD